jgi:hypothetical protein
MSRLPGLNREIFPSLYVFAAAAGPAPTKVAATAIVDWMKVRLEISFITEQ